jgi:hypothetical protein
VAHVARITNWECFFLSVLVTFPYHPPIIVGDYSMVANDISISQNGGYPKHPKPTRVSMLK